jgi:endoglucanase
MTDIAQFVITSDLDIVYYDNLYLHKNTVLSTNDFEALNVKLYPIPAKDLLNIEAPSIVERVAIYNILGQEVLNEVANNELVSVNVSSLIPGIYIVKATIEGKVSSTKFIKE